MKGLLNALREARSEIIGGLIVAAVLAVISKSYVGVSVWAIGLFVAGIAWASCAYVAFKRTPPLIEGGRGTWQYPRWRRQALAGLVVIPLLMAGGAGYHLYQPDRSSDKITIILADFDGPDPEQYGVTEHVVERLRAALAEYPDVQVQTLDQTITAQLEFNQPIQAKQTLVLPVDGEVELSCASGRVQFHKITPRTLVALSY